MGGQELKKSKKLEPESSTQKELNDDNNYVKLDINPSLVKHLNEIPTLILPAKLQLAQVSHAQVPDF